MHQILSENMEQFKALAELLAHSPDKAPPRQEAQAPTELDADEHEDDDGSREALERDLDVDDTIPEEVPSTTSNFEPAAEEAVQDSQDADPGSRVNNTASTEEQPPQPKPRRGGRRKKTSAAADDTATPGTEGDTGAKKKRAPSRRKQSKGN